jgi:hypothetical protein
MRPAAMSISPSHMPSMIAVGMNTLSASTPTHRAKTST